MSDRRRDITLLFATRFARMFAYGLLSIVLLIRDESFQKPGLRATVRFSILVMMVVLGLFPATWDPRLVAAGLYRYGARSLERFGSAGEYAAARRGVDLVYYKEGSESCVTIERTMQQSPGMPAAEALALTVDGKIEATTGVDIRTLGSGNTVDSIAISTNTPP